MPLLSPKGSYAEYLRHALETELRGANLYDADSKAVVEATLLYNEAPYSTETARVDARFRLRRNEQYVYDKVHSFEHVYDASLFSSVIPASMAVPIAFEGLVAAFLTDPEFLRAAGEGAK